MRMKCCPLRNRVASEKMTVLVVEPMKEPYVKEMSTPIFGRRRFHVTDMSREQMEAAGYGFHHESEDGKYLIMANGSRAFAIPNGDTPNIPRRDFPSWWLKELGEGRFCLPSPR